MKKLMIGAIAAFACLAVNASTCLWNAGAGWVAESDASGSSELAGYKVLFMDSQTITAADFIKALGTDGAQTFTDYAALGSGNISGDGDFYFVGDAEHHITGYDVPGEDNQFAKGYAVILNAADIKDATYAYVYEYDATELTTAVLKSEVGASFSADEIYTGAVGSAGWTQVAPEPTSGLLLLIGVAGLALRRRRA